MTEKPETTSDDDVQNVPNEQTSKTQTAVSLRSKGLSYKAIADKMSMPKSTVYRLVKDSGLQTKATTPAAEKRQDPLESLGSEYVPDMPPELLTDIELDMELKRHKKENAVLAARARRAFLEYRAVHPAQRYQSYMAHDGNSKSDDFRDKLLLKLLEGKTEPKDPFTLALEISKMLNAAGSNKSPGEIISEVMAVTESIRGLNPVQTSWSPEQAITFEKLKSDIASNKAKNMADARFKEKALDTVLEGLKTLQKHPAFKKVVDGALNKVTSKLGPPVSAGDQAEMATKFLCPTCLEKGTRSLIDVAGEPESVSCPECGREFHNREKSSETENVMSNGERLEEGE